MSAFIRGLFATILFAGILYAALKWAQRLAPTALPESAEARSGGLLDENDLTPEEKEAAIRELGAQIP